MIKEDYRAKEIKELYDRWSNAREDWDTAAREDIDFYLGNHFSEAEAEELASRNQSAVPMDRLYSAIEQFKAIITSKPPKLIKKRIMVEVKLSLNILIHSKYM
jgi:hypothetical protein